MLMDSSWWQQQQKNRPEILFPLIRSTPPFIFASATIFGCPAAICFNYYSPKISRQMICFLLFSLSAASVKQTTVETTLGRHSFVSLHFTAGPWAMRSEMLSSPEICVTFPSPVHPKIGILLPNNILRVLLLSVSLVYVAQMSNFTFFDSSNSTCANYLENDRFVNYNLFSKIKTMEVSFNFEENVACLSCYRANWQRRCCDYVRQLTATVTAIMTIP